MQIVIDIDDNLYTRLFDNGVDNYDDTVDMVESIRKGTPLPKGHGRLIDGDELESRMKIGYCIVRNAKTIVEADTECNNEDIPMEYFESGGR